MQLLRHGARGRERNVEAIDLLGESGKTMDRRGRKAAEACAITAGDAVQRAGGRCGVMPMRGMRDRIQAERQYEADEQSPRPMT